ncbi:hypothetical protein HZA43_04205 [Candidatus Peregrinibacteria bacterium]|nr:hypothetical protein [Candidatus Peregrinibacteria bacterium]
MSTLISIKDLRTSLSSVADAVAQGESFLVMRHSRPAFKVEPLKEEEEETMDMYGWKTIVDFTEGGKKKGIAAKKLLKIMREFEKKYG